ncbi:hypothetical protein [Paenibacillus sp. N3.4]|nr:hypothetical protein [Paenibacillus sp. N3.4]
MPSTDESAGAGAALCTATGILPSELQQTAIHGHMEALICDPQT